MCHSSVLLDRKLGPRGAHGRQPRGSEARGTRARRRYAARDEHHVLLLRRVRERSISSSRNTAIAPYWHLLYSRLGDLYVDKQRYQDGANTYRAFVARDPNSEYAPLTGDAGRSRRISKGGFSQLVLDGKHEFVERYNFGSPFWQGRERAQYPTGRAGAEDQSARRGDVFSCAARSLSHKTGGLPGGGALVPRLSDLVPG